MTGSRYQGPPVVCAFCGETFLPKWVWSRAKPAQRFCSTTCSNRGTGATRTGLRDQALAERDAYVLRQTEQGFTPVAIAEELAVHTATIYRTLRRYGVKPVVEVRRVPRRRDICKRGHDLLNPVVPLRVYVTKDGRLSRTCGVCVEERMAAYRARPEVLERHRLKQREYVARKREQIRRSSRRKSDWLTEQKAEIYAKAEAYDRLMAMVDAS